MRTVHAAIDHGFTLMDTAPAYSLGRRKRVLGKALKGRRDEVVLATGCGYLVARPAQRGGLRGRRGDGVQVSRARHDPRRA